MNRAFIVAGNWKMNLNYQDGMDLVAELVRKAPQEGVQVVLGTPFIHLREAAEKTHAHPIIHVAAQNCHHEEKGAYTGEISIDMIKSTGATYVIIGHSERREYFKEDDTLLARKTDATLEGGLTPIFCCGEPLNIREADQHEAYVAKQIQAGLFHLDPDQFKKVVVAYEPIWAIGTGVTASPQQAQDMHRHIRDHIAQQYGPSVAQGISILYGGSVKPANADELFSQPDVDGGLVGGASLKAADFVAIIEAGKKQEYTQ